jgi:hypothetical protein
MVLGVKPLILVAVVETESTAYRTGHLVGKIILLALAIMVIVDWHDGLRVVDGAVDSEWRHGSRKGIRFRSLLGGMFDPDEITRLLGMESTSAFGPRGAPTGMPGHSRKGKDIEASEIGIGVLTAMLRAAFPERDALVEQLQELKADPIDVNGSLKLMPAPSAPRAEVRRRIPVEAETGDRDGVTIHILLHVLEGHMHELEVYREDSARVETRPNPEEIRVVVL